MDPVLPISTDIGYVNDVEYKLENLVLDDEAKDQEQKGSNEDEAQYEISLIYDEKMAQHCDNKEEIQMRCALVYSKLEESKVLLSKHISRIQFDMISIENLAKVHSMDYIESVMVAENFDEGVVELMLSPETFENKFTPDCARLAAGGALAGMKDVVTSPAPVKSAFCLVRPPGHHSLISETNGYCFFNNAGVAAHFARELFGLKRVCIFDWDVHHGDGTQDIFYKTNEVLFISIHRHEHGAFFPYKECSAATFTGEQEGEGFNVNVAWNTVEKEEDVTQVGEKEYKFLCENLLFGIVKEYNPELLIISAGFDSAKDDPLGKQQVDHRTYHWISQNLQKICPKILMVLEGGYNMEALASCATISVKALMGYRNDFLFNDIDKSELVPEAFDCMVKTAEAHAKHWKAAQDFLDKFSS